MLVPVEFLIHTKHKCMHVPEIRKPRSAPVCVHSAVAALPLCEATLTLSKVGIASAGAAVTALVSAAALLRDSAARRSSILCKTRTAFGGGPLGSETDRGRFCCGALIPRRDRNLPNHRSQKMPTTVRPQKSPSHPATTSQQV